MFYVAGDDRLKKKVPVSWLCASAINRRLVDVLHDKEKHLSFLRKAHPCDGLLPRGVE